jgi:hypothetical protein
MWPMGYVAYDGGVTGAWLKRVAVEGEIGRAPQVLVTEHEVRPAEFMAP